MTEPWREKWVSDCGTVTLYLGDCLEILPTLEADEGSAIVADPPYGIAFAHGGGGGCLAKSTAFAGESITGDDKPFDPRPFIAWRQCVLWGANHFADKLPAETRWLTWDKRDGMASNDQADCEHAWTNLGGPARLYSHKPGYFEIAKRRIQDELRRVAFLDPTPKPAKQRELATLGRAGA